MRAPQVEELVRAFVERWEQAKDSADRLELAVGTVREAVLVGMAKGRARDGAADRSRRRMSPAARAIAAADAAVIQRVARASGLDAEAILSDDRSRSVSRWRFRAAWCLLRVRRRSSPQAAAVLRRRDHACVLRGARIVDAEIALDPALGRRLRKLAA